jgi:hypothetical protein
MSSWVGSAATGTGCTTSTAAVGRFRLDDFRRAGAAAAAPVDTIIDFSVLLFLGIFVG